MADGCNDHFYAQHLDRYIRLSVTTVDRLVPVYNFGVLGFDRYIPCLLYKQIGFVQHMADELHRDMTKPNSALKLFLRYAPDSIDHLLNR